MSSDTRKLARLRTRWGAIGAAIAVTLGGGGFGLAQASVSSGDKPITVNVDAGRALDTRFNIGLTGAFASATPRDVQITGEIDVATPDNQTVKRTVVPAGASAAIVNVTVVFPTDQGFLALRSGGASGEPSTSTVNFQAGSVEPNAATVPLSADGKLQVYVFMPTPGATANVLIDIVGYTTDHNHDDRYYTKAQVDEGTASINADIAKKADITTVYNKGETYNRTEIDTAIAAAGPARVVHVATDGGDFTSVSAALASIADASEANPYLIQIAPGRYTEPNGIDLKNYVDIQGSGRNATTITSTSGATSSATMRATGALTSEVSRLTIENTGGAGSSYGIRADDVPGRTLRFTEIAVRATNAGSRIAIELRDAGATVHDATLSASGGGFSTAFDIFGSASLDASDVVASANAALFMDGLADGSIIVRDSRLTGFPNTVVVNGSTAPLLIGVGVAAAVDGPATCVGSYTFPAGDMLSNSCVAP